jgi:high-affinity iron transporter
MSSGFNSYFDAAIASIFAREFIEGAVIIVNYRTVIKNAEHWSNAEEKKRALREVTVSAAMASFVATVMVAILAVVLGILSSHLSERVVYIVEGVSKLVAAVAIMQLSIKIPVWLGIYENVSLLPCRQRPMSVASHSMNDDNAEVKVATITLAEIRFNVAWNIWREVAECGVFLIPVFLSGNLQAIPFSALIGIVFAVILGIILSIALNRMSTKFWLALIMVLLTGIFSASLFKSAVHEFELLTGETPTVYVVQNPFFSSESFPMLIFEPFGYSTYETVLQIVSFWCWIFFACVLHYLKYRLSKKYKETQANAIKDDSEEEATRRISSSGTTSIDSTNNRDASVDLEANSPEG